MLALCLVALALATLPMLFSIYRTAAFNTIPRDDYAPYLLHILSQGGLRPGAPMVYRLLPVAVAAPFYYLLPRYTFTNLRSAEPNYLRATFALSFVSYLSMLLTAAAIYLICRRRLLTSRMSSLVTALLAFMMEGHVAATGIDPFVILVTALLMYALPRPVVFVPLIVLSAGVCEKIPILFAAVLTTRFLFDRQATRGPESRPQSWPLLLAAWGAVALYWTAVLICRFPGSGQLLAASHWMEHLATTLSCSLSLKGLMLNVLPVALLLGMGYLGWTARTRRPRGSMVGEPCDMLGVLVLPVCAALAGVQCNVGRIAMHGYPLLLPGVALMLDSAIDGGGTS